LALSTVSLFCLASSFPVEVVSTFCLAELPLAPSTAFLPSLASSVPVVSVFTSWLAVIIFLLHQQQLFYPL
ncbi:hypothetical protein, partial [Metaclostridioides mangenotii]|uniref:hypothetical protein n=1 Tax=Metaclostridioides mangenotii TaxID=1540 RepID=UPI001A994A9A